MCKHKELGEVTPVLERLERRKKVYKLKKNERNDLQSLKEKKQQLEKMVFQQEKLVDEIEVLLSTMLLDNSSQEHQERGYQLQEPQTQTAAAAEGEAKQAQ